MNTVVRASVELGFRNFRCRQVLPVRRCSEEKSNPGETGPNVAGLSKNVVDVPATEVGFPGASKSATYKNPEYFCYNNVSYFEAEVEMTKYRLPQPSNKRGKK